VPTFSEGDNSSFDVARENDKAPLTLLPTSLVVVEKAWKRYVETDQLDVASIRPEVASSWQRCRNLRIDPLREPRGDVSALLLRETLAKAKNLIKIARPFMENLYAFVKGSGFEVILTDASGFVLEVLGDSEIVSKTARVQLCPGGNWSEATKATNAIGTAIIERKPVQIYAWEHYCQTHHFLTCSAAPIFNVDGTIIGVLDISGDYRMANPHTLGMVVAAVNAIESQLRLQRATASLYLAYRHSNILLQNMSDGLISIDAHGIVTEINPRGAEIFGVSPVLAKGQHITQISDGCAAILPILSRATEREAGEVVLNRMGREISSSVSLLRDESQGVIGAVAVFRELKRQPTRRLGLVHEHHYTFEDIVGESPAIAALKEWAKLAAASPFTVLISGETGTGKELFAQAIHTASPRMDRPFIAINCAALPESLIESELFGYEEGAFTGARRGGQAGKFEIADGGTIFLDEIGDMSGSVQMKLLRVIQENRVTRVGSARERAVDVRIIAATHRELSLEVAKGSFREDLYYRLNVLEMRIPPLRERMEDIPALARHLIEKITLRLNCKTIPMSEDFLGSLQRYSWPGNIRELENAIERAIIRARGAEVLGIDLLDFQSREQTNGSSKVVEIRHLRQIEKDAVAQALSHCHGNIQKTSAKLGIGRNTLYRKMKKYGLS
jgi:sigma-54 dependent transcriptional regulator, acetoin dehydrogenase operon transcriptional activator AcoR